MISLTQWASLALALTIMVLSVKWRAGEEFDPIFPVLFLMGLHTFLFYGTLLGYRVAGYDTTLNLYPFAWFPFETWSPVLRLHTQASVLIIMAVRSLQHTRRQKAHKEMRRLLKSGGK